MYSMLLVGFIGKMHSGKDTCGDYLVTKYSFEKHNFADPVKQIAHIVFGFNNKQLYEKEKDELDEYWQLTPRECLQKIGTDLFRNQIREDIWIKSMEHKLLIQPNKNYVICDVRFPNEADFIKKMGGILIKIEREKEIHSSNSTLHSSEIIDNIPFDYLITNNKDIPWLHQQLENIYRMII